jgi:hypothetical protein
MLSGLAEARTTIVCGRTHILSRTIQIIAWLGDTRVIGLLAARYLQGLGVDDRHAVTQ